jgi:hypothetical protein
MNKKHTHKLAIILMVLVLNFSTNAQTITGRVFKDANFDGIMQAQERGFAGAVINAYGANNSLVASGTSITNGNFAAIGNYALNVPVGIPVRLEIIVNGVEITKANSLAANNSQGNVRFVNAGSAITPTIVNFGVTAKQWYTPVSNPYTATTLASAGTINGTSGNNASLYVFPWSMSDYDATTEVATPNIGSAVNRIPFNQLGATFGLAYQNTSRTLLISAYLKRHVGFGPGGIDAIYRTNINASGVPTNATLLFNLSNLGINVGANPRTTNARDTLSINGNFPSQDSSVYSQIGQRGIGGITISDDGRYLFVVNMFQNALHKIFIGNPIKATHSSADVTTYNITVPAGAGFIWRPMAVKYSAGAVFVGGVLVKQISGTFTTADTTGQRMVVYKFNTETNVFSQVLTHPLTYRKGFINGDIRYPNRNNFWLPWQQNGDSATLVQNLNSFYVAGQPHENNVDGGVYFPQPMLSNIEFDNDGAMLIGLRDRFGDQMGAQNFSTDAKPRRGFGFYNPTYNTTLNQNYNSGLYFRALSASDVLKAGANSNGSFTMEANGRVNSFGLEIKSARADSTRTSFNAATTPESASTANGWRWNGALSYNVGTAPYYTNDVFPAGNVPFGGFMGPDWVNGGTPVTTAVAGVTVNAGTRGAYFYYNHDYDQEPGIANNYPNTINGKATVGSNRAHYVKGTGGLASYNGELAMTAIDPYFEAWGQGILKFSNERGSLTQRVLLRNGNSPNGPDRVLLGKAAATGDLEVLVDEQPIEIGNRVWNDANFNGIQDAGEAGIAGVIIRLYAPGNDNTFGNADDIQLKQVTTNANGEYYISGLDVADARRPASFTGIGALQILPGFNYQLRIENINGANKQAALALYRPTIFNVGNNANNTIDSDGGIVGTNIVETFNSFTTNFDFDFGFKATAAIGNKVWRDDNKDGTQDPEEPGITGVTVTLFTNGPNGTPGNNDDVFVKATVTDAYGLYIFEDLTPSTVGLNSTLYNARFTIPPNYQFTSQTNTQNTNGTATTSTGVSTAATGSDANTTLGQTGSYFLFPATYKDSVDGGIVFAEPTSKSTIGDRVWLDANSNGNQDAVTTEPGISGVTVALLKETTAGSNVYTIFSTTKTDAKGFYLFTELPNNSNYKVKISIPPGALITTATALSVADNTINNDFPATGLSDVINIPTAGANYRGVDAGIVLQASNKCAIGDRAWHDVNRNGKQEANEPGIPNVVVSLHKIENGFENQIASTTTDAFGYYIFNNLDEGRYRIQFLSVTGLTRTLQDVNGSDAVDSDAAAADGKTGTYTLFAGRRNLTVDAGYFGTVQQNLVGALGDKVWNDANNNGTQDAGEFGVAGVKATLINSSGVAIATTFTNEDGFYLFPNLTPANYTVRFEQLPTGYSFVNAKVGTDNTIDSDANIATGVSIVATVTAGLTNTTVDCGIKQSINSGLATLGNRVWYDINNNGRQDANETGVKDAIVQLYLDANNDGQITGTTEQTPIQTEKTNALGEYIFKGLAAGNYQVAFSALPTGFTLATRNASGVNIAEDSDGNGLGTAIAGNTATVGKTYTTLIPLAQGEDNLTIDLGVVPIATTNTLGDKVWFDQNQNGQQDATEVGVAGIIVTLFNSSGTQLANTTTDSKGQYLFTAIPDGTYYVNFSQLPNGFSFTNPSVANDATGSDADKINGNTFTVTLGAANRVDRSLDAGIITDKAALGNYVWFDFNRDGIQNANELPLPGATVTLYRFGFGLDGIANTPDDALAVASAITDGNGGYFFPNLEPGNYDIEFGTTPNFTVFTKANVTTGGGTDVNDSDVNPATGRTAMYTLNAGDVNLTVDAGVATPLKARVGDYVWADTDRNGRQDNVELGVAGVLVTLFNSSGNAIGASITNGDGLWRISNLDAISNVYCTFNTNVVGFVTNAVPVNSQVGFTGQNTSVNTNATQGLDNPTESNTDSDVLQIGASAGRTASFTITDGADYVNIDAGIIIPEARLPIQLISFIATGTNRNTVNVNWQVATETNVAYYQVEHSINGNNYTAFTNVATNSSGNYNGVHNNPIIGLNYYRLKIVDADGTITYSPIRTVLFTGGTTGIKIYPNPLVQSAVVTLPTTWANKNIQLLVYAIDGKLVQTTTTITTGNYINFMPNKLANGKYLLVLQNGTEKEVLSIVINR